MLQEYDWKDIFKDYEFIAKNISPDLLEPVDCKEIKFKYDGQYGIKGFDWIHISDFDKRIKFVTEETNAFLYFGTSLNKGTLQTLEYLVGAKDNKEMIGAIWLYATLKELTDYLPENWRGKGFKIISGAQNSIFSYLREHNITWHHAMKSLVPEMYFSYSILDNLVLEDLNQLIEITVMNVSLVLENYSIVYYESYK